MIFIAYRNIVLTQRAVVKSKDKQLKIALEFDENHSIPIEDISSVMIETEKVQISSHALRELALNGSVVYFCDEKHMPCGILLPLNSHSRQLKVLHMQLELKKPLKKRMWQQIIQQKVLNQAECLKMCGNKEHERIAKLAKRVQSGDSTFVESQAATQYFKLLFGRGFKRKNKPTKEAIDEINIALNYGYSIFRAAIARNLVVYGFEPSMGIFHHNETNRYNLADDLLEPYRPIVDLFVAQNINGESFTTSDKRQLFNLLNMGIISGDEKHSIMYALERTVQSFSSICRDKAGDLILPSLCPLIIHRYE